MFLPAAAPEVVAPLPPGPPVIPDLVVGDWIVLAEAGKPWFGVITQTLRDGQLQVHHHDFAARGGLVLPIWRDDEGRIKLSKKQPRGEVWSPQAYTVSSDGFVATAPRQKRYALPDVLLEAIATYNRGGPA